MVELGECAYMCETVYWVEYDAIMLLFVIIGGR
jgi:hypothetical protein